MTLKTVDTSKPTPPTPASVEMAYRRGVLDGFNTGGRALYAKEVGVNRKHAHGYRLGQSLRSEHKGKSRAALGDQIAAWATREALERDGITGAPGTGAAGQKLWGVDLNA